MHTVLEDFAHKRKFQLNHGGFGCPPKVVIDETEHYRQRWRHCPDEFRATDLYDKLESAAASCIPALTSGHLPARQVCLLDNATTCIAVIAKRWQRLVLHRAHFDADDRTIVFVLDTVYGASKMCLEEYCVKANGPAFRDRSAVVTLNIFQGYGSLPKNETDILERFRLSLLKETEALKALPARDVLKDEGYHGHLLFFLDHVSSMPSFVLPVGKMIKLIPGVLKEQGLEDKVCVREMAIDGAHAFSIPGLDVLRDFGDVSSHGDEVPLFWFSNFHKWAFGDATCAVLANLRGRNMQEDQTEMHGMHHVVPSWNWGDECPTLKKESQWVGTRDYSPLLSVPKAVEYYRNWRGPNYETAPAFCKKMVLKASRHLAQAWETEESLAQDESLVSAMAMIRLPDGIQANCCGRDGAKRNFRNVLREDHGVEVYIGEWDGIPGAWIRLSYAVYNTWEDIEKLKHAVICEWEKIAIEDGKKRGQAEVLTKTKEKRRKI